MFRLLRYFSIASLILIVAAAFLLGVFYRSVAVDNLMQMGERNNVALTGALSNALQVEFEPLLRADVGVADPVQHQQRLSNLDASVLRYTRGLSVAKVKIYDVRGKTVYSSDPKQIGEDKRANHGFQSALAGQPVSELTHRDNFSAFEQTIVNRDLLSSYIPVWRGQPREVQAVFEIYDDLTPLLARVSATQRQIMGGVALVLAGLYGILFLIVRHADRILRRQHVDQLQHEHELKAARNTLEQRVRDRTAELEQAIATLKDEIHERRRTEQQLIEAKRIADEASQAKSQFLANMSHEIRTPMNGVLGMTELLLDTALSVAQRHYAQTIRNSADSLLGIINDILDFSKIEAGKMELEAVDFDLRELTEEVGEMAAGGAHAKGLELVCRIDEAVPVTVRGDAGRLRQVLTNLVGNAVKFTESGEVAIEVRRSRQAPAAGVACLLEFSITDTGIGITEETSKRLFTAFTQADGSTTRRFGGTGLGLAISRQLVTLMGGSIDMQSTPGRGSRFWFTAAFAAAQATVTGSVSRYDLRGLEVLMVEDNDTNREILLHHATTWQMHATVVPDAAAALAALEAVRRSGGRQFDLALIDGKLPGMDGIELAHAIGTSLGPAAPPLILLTSSTASNVAQAAREAGFAAHLSKPLRRQELYRTIARTVGATNTAPAPAAAPAADQVDGGHVLLVEDNLVNQDISAAMLCALGLSVAVANNGIEAVAMFGRDRYDLVLMDCQMPEMDGFEATAEIRSREAQSGAPRTRIVALTANAMQGDRERCLAAGMDDYLAKPFSKLQLAAMIAPPVAPTDAAQRHSAAPAGPAADAQVPPVLDRSALANIRALERPGMPSLLARVIDHYLTDAPRLIEQMQLAQRKADAPSLARAAHTLKSASANVGARHPAEICKAIEASVRNGDNAHAAALLGQLQAQIDIAVAALRVELAEATG